MFYTVLHTDSLNKPKDWEAVSQLPPSSGTHCSSSAHTGLGMPTGLSGLCTECYMRWCSTQQMDHSDPAQKGGIRSSQMLSLSLPACLQACTQFFQDTDLSLWLPISLQVSVPRDLAFE